MRGGGEQRQNQRGRNGSSNTKQGPLMGSRPVCTRWVVTEQRLSVSQVNRSRLCSVHPCAARREQRNQEEQTAADSLDAPCDEVFLAGRTLNAGLLSVKRVGQI